MTRDCEFLMRVRAKPDMFQVIRCSLTGRACFCEGYPLNCTRRTFALAYIVEHPPIQPRPAEVTITD
jgi:hypothetical protein